MHGDAMLWVLIYTLVFYENMSIFCYCNFVLSWFSVFLAPVRPNCVQRIPLAPPLLGNWQMLNTQDPASSNDAILYVLNHEHCP